MKKIISVLLCVLLLATLLPVSAFADTTAGGTCGDNLTWTLEDGTLTISGTGKMKNYYPSNNDTTAPWGENCSLIKSVVISDGVTSIGYGAFYNCSSLTSVTIPDSVTSIGYSAFENCSSLTSVTIGNSVTSIGWYVFSGCSSLTSVTIGNSVTSIGERAFYNCSSLTSVTIPDSVTSIGDYAFCDCSSLASVTIPDSVTSIGSSAFSFCSSLASVTIPDSVTTIGDWAFYNCSSLTSVTIPDSVTSIGSSVFYNCSSLASVTIPDSVTSIGGRAFCDCSSLTSVTIPDSVTSIDYSAFSGCSSLTSVTIPDSVTSIGSSVFYNCSCLASVTIPNSVTSIGNSAFRGCSSLTSVTIPDSVTSIGDYAFSYCSNLTSVTIPDSVTSIGDDAFSYCSNLTSVTIPDSVTSIGDDAFFDCSSLTSVTIPDSVTSIGYWAFRLCSKLNDIAFAGSKDAWASIEKVDEAFSTSPRIHYNCTTLEGHIIPMERKDPSCISTGYIKYSCACGYMYTEVLPENHDYVFIKSVAATCSNAGYDVYKCSKCGKILNKSNGEEQLPHEYEFTKVVEPTCLKGGYTLYKCSVCGDEYKDNLTPLLGHSMVEVGEKPATCTEAGHTAGVQCSRCGLVESGVTEIPALGHSYGNWTQTKAPTCTAKGTEARTCTRCNAAQTRDVAALGHSYKNGKCTRCGAADPNYKPAPKAPELKITTSAGKPKIYWNAVDGAAKYWVYRSTDGKNFKYYDSTTKTSYTNSSTSIGTTYYYKVKTIGTNGAASDLSSVVSILCKPAAPSVSINRSNGKPKLSWKAVSGATKYWIYRSTDGKEFKYFDSTTKTSYTNSGAASGTKYYYRVKAVTVVNGKNVASANSSTKSLMTTLAKPSVSITTSNGKPKLTWKAVTGADKYYVYRSTDGKNFSYWDSTTKTTYINSGAKKNTKYYYKVKAVCASNSNANSAQSAAVSIKATK